MVETTSETDGHRRHLDAALGEPEEGIQGGKTPLESGLERTQRLLDSVPVAYVVLSPQNDGKAINDHVFPFVQANSRAWKCVYVDNESLVHIYERARSEDMGKGDWSRSIGSRQ